MASSRELYPLNLHGRHYGAVATVYGQLSRAERQQGDAFAKLLELAAWENTVSYLVLSLGKKVVKCSAYLIQLDAPPLNLLTGV